MNKPLNLFIDYPKYESVLINVDNFIRERNAKNINNQNLDKSTPINLGNVLLTPK